jgi:hypothetical protein
MGKRGDINNTLIFFEHTPYPKDSTSYSVEFFVAEIIMFGTLNNGTVFQ